MNVMENIRKTMGWCPNATFENKRGELYMVSYEGKFIDKIKGMGFKGFLGILHLVFAVWLISTALWVLSKREIFPWWGMDINIISSGILLAIGGSSLIISLNFIKSANIHRILALVNIILLAGLSLYLSQFPVSSGFIDLSTFFNRLYNYYSFDLNTLVLFTFIVAIPNVLTFFIKPAGETKKGFLTAALLVFILVFASVGAYYLHLSKQKDEMLAEEFGESGYKLYKIEPGTSWDASFGIGSMYPYFLDLPGDTTGHPISKDTYEAMHFLRNKETGKVLAWWDFELEIKAAGKEPVISYASEAIKNTIARPASLYDKFEPDEKVADVSRFFSTDSEDVAKGIARKYGADIVYVSRPRINDLIGVMIFAANPDFYSLDQDIKTPDAYLEKNIMTTIAYKFNSGAELKYFEKIFENKDVIIYQVN